eukprot:m.208708 g.208708  ORF g.208708 m.208708 type:complete len:664 (-) comp17801_c1_seq2:2805-4796(-)
MSAFGARFNAATGQHEWVARDSDEDSASGELSASFYGDMLNDTERNRQYEAAIAWAVRTAGPQAVVLDIGTGTGLLAMMAVRAGASRVFACEVFVPMARIARRVIHDNGMSDRITLLEQRSTDLTERSLPERADIIVSEVLDTELIGEGVLETMRHALQHLAKPNCIVVPARASIWVQPFQSPDLRLYQSLHKATIGSISLMPPEAASGIASTCRGPASMFELRLDDRPEPILTLAPPLCAIDFDFRTSAQYAETEQIHSREHQLALTQRGTVDGLVAWWAVELAPGITLSTAPKWINPQAAWRDHWMQLLHSLPQALPCAKGDTLDLTVRHDDYRVWFDLRRQGQAALPEDERPGCTCLAHSVLCRPRIRLLSTAGYVQQYEKAIASVVTDCLPPVNVFCAGHWPIGLAACALPKVVKVFVVELSPNSQHYLRDVLPSTSPQGRKIDLVGADLTGVTAPINVVFAEPFFPAVRLPWEHACVFWTLCESLRPRLARDACIIPRRGVLRIMLVQFEHMHTLRCAPSEVSGFNLQSFQEACHASPADFDVAYLSFEYAFTRLSDPLSLQTLDFATTPSSSTVQLDVPLMRTGSINGVAVWMDYDLGPSNKLDGGPDSYQALYQGVQILRSPLDVAAGDSIRMAVRLDVPTADLSIEFERPAPRSL